MDSERIICNVDEAGRVDTTIASLLCAVFSTGD